MTSSPHGPYVRGWKRATMAGTKGCDTARWSQSQKTGLSSDWSLQLDSMNVGIASNRGSACHGEYVPGSCTHRPSSDESREYPKSVT